MMSFVILLCSLGICAGDWTTVYKDSHHSNYDRSISGNEPWDWYSESFSFEPTLSIKEVVINKETVAISTINLHNKVIPSILYFCNRTNGNFIGKYQKDIYEMSNLIYTDDGLFYVAFNTNGSIGSYLVNESGIIDGFNQPLDVVEMVYLNNDIMFFQMNWRSNNGSVFRTVDLTTKQEIWRLETKSKTFIVADNWLYFFDFVSWSIVIADVLNGKTVHIIKVNVGSGIGDFLISKTEPGTIYALHVSSAMYFAKYVVGENGATWTSEFFTTTVGYGGIVLDNTGKYLCISDLRKLFFIDTMTGNSTNIIMDPIYYKIIGITRKNHLVVYIYMGSIDILEIPTGKKINSLPGSKTCVLDENSIICCYPRGDRIVTYYCKKQLLY